MDKLEESINFKGPLRRAMKHYRFFYIFLKVLATLLVIGLAVQQLSKINLAELPQIVIIILFAILMLILIYTAILCLVMAYSGFAYKEIVIGGELITHGMAYVFAAFYLAIGAIVMYGAARALFYAISYFGFGVLPG